MNVKKLEKLSYVQQAIWDSIPCDLRNVLCSLTWDEHLQLIGKEKETFETPYMERFFKIRFLSNNPTPLFLDQIEEATVYTYKNVILELQLPGKPLLQLGFPYKETEHISVQHWDSHTHEHWTNNNVAVKCYHYLCYCSKHPLIQEYLENEKQKKDTH